MATAIILVLQGPDSEGGHQAFVSEEFDEVLEKVQPTRSPSSALESRAASIYHDLDGNRIYIPHNIVGWVHENQEPEE